MNEPHNSLPPSSSGESSRLLLLELMKYRSMPGQAPKKLLEDIVKLIDSSYKVIGLYGCGAEAFIIKVETPLTDERCLKVVFPSEGIEGQRTVTLWKTVTSLGVAKTNFQVHNESVSRLRFKEGSKLQTKIVRAIQEANLSYFYVPSVYKVSDAPLYIEMEWIPSVPVLQYLHEQRDILKSLQCFCNLCKAVHFCHERGIIHRDLKPDNIYIWKNLGVCILDWSISKEMGDRNLTVSGFFLGTKPYLSPIQAQDAKTATHLDDIHYLGYTFAAFVSEKDLPIVLDSKKDYSRLLAKYQKKICEDLPEVMRPIFLKATALDETVRYQTADEMREDVEKIITSFSPPQNVFTPQPSVVLPPNLLNDKTPVFSTNNEQILPPMIQQMGELEMKCLARFLSDQMVKTCSKASATAILKKGMNAEDICPDTCDHCQHINEALILTICKVISTMKEWRYL